MAITPTTIASTFLQQVGSVSKGAANVAGTVETQAELTRSAGTAKSVDAQREANRDQDKNGAEMTKLMSDATIANQQQSTMNAINSMQMDTTNKELSALAKNATGINF